MTIDVIWGIETTSISNSAPNWHEHFFPDLFYLCEWHLPLVSIPFSMHLLYLQAAQFLRVYRDTVHLLSNLQVNTSLRCTARLKKPLQLSHDSTP